MALPPSKMIAFFCALPHTQVDYLEQTIQEYHSLTMYIIAMETSTTSHQDFSGQHFHFFCDMSPKDYHLFAQRVFNRKFHLRGQAKPGLARQYGKVRDIQDLNAMAAYTLKDQNFRTNMEPCIIQNLLALSFKKGQHRSFRDDLFKFLKEQYSKDPYELRTQIIEYFRIGREKHNDVACSRSTIQALLIRYMLYEAPEVFSIQAIENFIFA